MASGLICVGSIARPHGIRGECVADVDLEDPELLLRVHEIHLFSPDRWPARQGDVLPEPSLLRSCREHRGRLLLTFKGVDDRNAAETLRGRLLCLPESALPMPDEDEVYCYQLVGCKVLLPDGSELGVVSEVSTPTPEQEIWTIETPQGSEVLFPAHPETVEDIDIQAQQVRIAPPEGLLEIYLEK